jgi:hypothetical protein
MPDTNEADEMSLVLLNIFDAQMELESDFSDIVILSRNLDTLQEIRAEVAEYGTDDRFNRLISSDDTIKLLVPALARADVEVALHDLDIVTEGLLENIKSRIGNVVEKIKLSFAANSSHAAVRKKIKERLEKLASRKGQEDFAKIASKQINGIPLKYLTPTYSVCKKMLAKEPPLPDKISKGSKSPVDAYTQLLKAYGNSVCPATPNSIVVWKDNVRAVYDRTKGTRKPKTLEDLGITSIDKLKQFCKFVTTENEGVLISAEMLSKISSMKTNYSNAIGDALDKLGGYSDGEKNKNGIGNAELSHMSMLAMNACITRIYTAGVVDNTFLLMAYAAIIKI